MNLRFSERKQTLLLLVAFGATSPFLFQNCGRGFEGIQSQDQISQSSSSSPSPTQSPSPSPIPSATPTTGAILRVCKTGCPYSLPSQAIAFATNGATIEINYGIYVDCFATSLNDLTLRGVPNSSGSRPVIKEKICAGKGIIVFSGDLTANTGRNLTIENLELSGANLYSLNQNTDGNGAAIRHQGYGLTVRNCFIHDNQDGILAGSSSGETSDNILIENSIFYRNGTSRSAKGEGYAHNLYIGRSKSLIFRSNISIEAIYQGHELKSRAENNSVSCSVIANLESKDSYTLDIPQGGLTVVRNNILQQGPNSANTGILTYFLENVPANTSGTEVVFQENLILNDNSTGTYFAVGNSGHLSLINNLLIGPGSLTSLRGTSVLAQNTGTTLYSDRAAYRAATGVGLPNYASGGPLPDLDSRWSCPSLYPAAFSSLDTYIQFLKLNTPRPSWWTANGIY